MTLAQAITRAKADEALAGIRVHDLLQCLPGIGPKRATAVMEEIGISSARRIRGLGSHQVDALVAREAA
jgi:ribosomal protein S13